MKRPSRFSFLCRTPCRAILFLGCLLLATQGRADTGAPQLPALSCHPHQAVDFAEDKNSDAFNEAIAGFSAEMAERHDFDRQDLDCILGRIRHNPAVIRLVSPFPAGTPKNWQAYRARFIEPVRITAGAKFWKRHRKALQKAEEIYGIPPEIVVGILGIETIYGRNKGNFRVLDALATLAFDYPEHPKREARQALFRNELENTLLLSAERGIDPLSLKGSYAGAIGWPQFLPSSVRKYAVDFDGNGTIDLRNSPVDAIGSVANFLALHGWKKDAPVVFPAELRPDCQHPPDAALNRGLAATLTPDELPGACVTPKTALPGNTLFGLVDLQNGFDPTEYWLGTDNFFAITHYNRSYFYAMAVIDLGRAVRAVREGNRAK